MKKILVALFVGLAVVISLGAACQKNNSQPVSSSQVAMKNTAFTPNDITVSPDTVVTWTNDDTISHQIASDDNVPDFASGVLEPGSTFMFTFSDTGTFKYHCTIHPSMTGQVVVQ